MILSSECIYIKNPGFRIAIIVVADIILDSLSLIPFPLYLYISSSLWR
jgi:hypothetical protein